MIISKVREIRAKAQSSSLVTGFWGAIAQSVPGTEATNLASKVRQLRIMMADQQSLTLAPGSPLPRRSKWACDMLASSIAAVDTSLSNRAFLENLKVVESHFVRVYGQQGGKDFDADLKALED